MYKKEKRTTTFNVLGVLVFGVLLIGCNESEKPSTEESPAVAENTVKENAVAKTAVVDTAIVETVIVETTAKENKAWKNLFDGETLSGWTGANGADIGSQWQVVNGNLVLTSAGGGDIATVDTYSNFELSLEWKISEKGNSGIFYRVASDGDPVWMSGVEYQILDDTGYTDLSSDSHKAGGVYDMYPPLVDNLKPVGQFNLSRIIVNGNHVEHWLNGKKIVEYEWKSDDWNRRLNASKFKDWKNFGKFQSGHIALQDHGNKVSFRNIKIREL